MSLHLKILQEKLGIFIPDDKITNIVELGGGYGNLARLIRNFGYDGKYTIIDFPLISKIQKDYLSRNNINDVIFSELNKASLTPQNNDVSILIGTYSISEMPMAERSYLELYYKYYSYIFIAHNDSFDGIDNLSYFKPISFFSVFLLFLFLKQ